MNKRTLRLTAMSAAVAALVIVPQSSSVAMLDASSGAVNARHVSAAGEHEADVTPRAPIDLGPRPNASSGPSPAQDCFPIGQVEPTNPRATELPEVAPRVPPPVPIPEVTTACTPGRVPAPLDLMGERSRAR